MRKQKITHPRPELAPWPHAKANIGGVGSADAAAETKTTPVQIAAICSAMDTMPSSVPKTNYEGKKSNYVPHNLPPNGMRIQQPKRPRFRRVLRG